MNFGSVKIVLLIAILYIVAKKKTIYFIHLFKNEILFTLILVAYSLLTSLLGDGSALTVPYKHVIWFMECFIVPSFFMFFFKDIFHRLAWETVVVPVGFFASLITFYLIMNPDINFIIRTSVIENAEKVSSQYSIFRGYSIADGANFSYGIVQGLILSICLLSIKKNILYVVPIFFLAISILFNSRIGFSVVLVSMLLILIFKEYKFSTIVSICIVLYLGTYILFESSFYQSNEQSIKWGVRIFQDTQRFDVEDANSNYYNLYRMLVLPSSLAGIFFGEGKTLFASIYQSDIGFINQMFIGGLVYLIAMLLFLWFIFWRNYKYSTNRIYPFLFLFSLLVVNIKGDALFVPSGFFRLISFYYVYCIFMVENDTKIAR